MPNMRPPHALSAGRLAALGATRGSTTGCEASVPPVAAHRRLRRHARRQPRPQPGVRASARRHARVASGPEVRRGLRPRRRLLHDDGARPAARDGDRLGPLPSGRRRALRTGHARENFHPGTTSGGCDERAAGGGPDGACSRGLRYLEWVWDPDPDDTQYVADYAFLLRERDGSVHAMRDRHVEGLFARDRWLALLADVGFSARSAPLVLSDTPAGTRCSWVAGPADQPAPRRF